MHYSDTDAIRNIFDSDESIIVSYGELMIEVTSMGLLDGIGGALGGMLSSPEGKEQIMKYLSSPEGMAMLQQFIGTPEGKKLAGQLLMPILGNLGVPEAIKQSIEQYL